MITLTTPVSFAGETDANTDLATTRWDNLNQFLELTEIYGNSSGTPPVFTPSNMLPGVGVQVNLSTGTISVNGNTLMSGGNPVTLGATQLAAVNTAMDNFQKAVETELVALNIFAGTVS